MGMGISTVRYDIITFPVFLSFHIPLLKVLKVVISLKVQLVKYFVKKMEEKKWVTLWSPFMEDLKDTLTNICNTIINNGTYCKITLREGWKGEDFTRIAQAINKAPSLTSLELYPFKKRLFFLLFVNNNCYIIMHSPEVGASLWLNQITHLRALSLVGNKINS